MRMVRLRSGKTLTQATPAQQYFRNGFVTVGILKPHRELRGKGMTQFFRIGGTVLKDVMQL
jgi:hypothetical protein